MSHAMRRWAVTGLALATVACVCAFFLTLPPLWPLEARQARQRWEQAQVRHYEVEVAWADGWSYGHARVEMRDGLFVSGVDLETGQPLAASKRLAASYFASVDQVFAIVEERVWPSVDWRIILSRYHPALRRWLKPCIPPLSSVSFDRELGYPTSVFYNNSWCNRATFFTYSQVRIISLKPLP